MDDTEIQRRLEALSARIGELEQHTKQKFDERLGPSREPTQQERQRMRDELQAVLNATKAKIVLPVDRSQVTLTTGAPVTPDHREIDPATGMQRGYVVLSAEERAKGFVRPVRRSYRHQSCGTVTTMGQSLAETYARDPRFYGGTFCCGCGTHFPVNEFLWDDNSGSQVGS